MSRSAATQIRRNRLQRFHLRKFEALAVQNDFGDERVVRDHHRNRPEACLQRETARGRRSKLVSYDVRSAFDARCSKADGILDE